MFLARLVEERWPRDEVLADRHRTWPPDGADDDLAPYRRRRLLADIPEHPHPRLHAEVRTVLRAHDGPEDPVTVLALLKGRYPDRYGGWSATQLAAELDA